MPFPDNGLVYDYRLDDGGASKTKEDEDEEETKKAKVSALCHNLMGYKVDMIIN